MCCATGYLPSTFVVLNCATGATATEVTDRRELSETTRDKKSRYGRCAARRRRACVRHAGRTRRRARCRLWRPGQPDPAELARTAQALLAAEAASTEVRLRMVHPSGTTTRSTPRSPPSMPRPAVLFPTLRFSVESKTVTRPYDCRHLQRRCGVQSIGYWEAWSHWWSMDRSLGGMKMWGVPIPWWGRIGKLLQFCGGLVVVVDLIGSDRLNRAATKTRQAAKKAPEWLGEGWPAGIICVILFGSILFIIIFGINTAITEIPRVENEFFGVIALFATLPLIVIVWLTAFFGALLAARLLLYAAHFPFLALAWIFDSNRPGHPARWVAFGLVLTGFHFDLLAS
jgi:uncharacterized integral membrane protein